MEKKFFFYGSEAFQSGRSSPIYKNKGITFDLLIMISWYKQGFCLCPNPFTSLLFLVSLLTPPSPPTLFRHPNLQTSGPLFIYLDPYKSLHSIEDCNSTGNYLWGFEIFNTIFKIPLNGVYMVVILSLTNSNITLNLRLANAPENSRVYVTFLNFFQLPNFNELSLCEHGKGL